MGRPVVVRLVALALMGGWLAAIPPVFAQQAAEGLRKAADNEIQAADTEAMFKKVDLTLKYSTALEGLEKTLAASGQLDAIIHVREEREAVKKSGETTAHTDKPLVELREKYQKGVEAIDSGLKAARGKVMESLAKRLREQETALTKAGKIDDALALRKDGDKMMLELSGGAGADAVPFADDPRAKMSPTANPLGAIKIPEEKPATFATAFQIEGRWLESMTVPVAKQKVREAIVIGDRMKKKWPLVVLSPGSMWSGADQGRVELSGCNFVARKCKFESLTLGADHACIFYFQNCSFNDCTFPKAGVWYGGDHAAKFYLESCHVKGSYAKGINFVDHGVRVESSVFEGAEMPHVNFVKHQPADIVNDKWFRVVGSRFIQCKVPLSFVLITRDCLFEGCTFENDMEKDAGAWVTKPYEAVIYSSNTKSRMRDLPANVKFTEKSYNELKGVTVPTAVSLADAMAR